MTSTTADPRTARRAELADFLRVRRERVTPGEVGLAVGGRRRTPGLRREEVAQLAGVGVTWYTWLEQGRPINASTQVLDAVARVLHLDPAEHQHLYRLAGARAALPPDRASHAEIPAPVREVVAAMHPIPATLINERFDLLVWNQPWQTLIETLYDVPCGHRNLMWCSFTDPQVRAGVENWEFEGPHLVAMFRAAYAEHLHDPRWRAFVSDLRAHSDEFAILWDRHEVAAPATSHRVFRHPSAGRLAFTTLSLEVTEMPGCRILTYVPADEPTRAAMLELTA
ncbi:helix-turn-helix transcriptional regulator [Actinoplanes sp. NPDC048988]|uniref:helix-turn-helix transcriptional regulator n=1 Tax=Actinoplanes sp. NPDC048988 TaxID=3363901 RepID=UPI00371154FF